MFRRKKAAPESPEPYFPAVEPAVVETLERLQKLGAQLVARPGGPAGEAYTTSVLGLGKDGFFVDTLSPPEGDAKVRPGVLLSLESLFQGTTYRLETTVLGRVQFIDELPAFKLEYPLQLDAVRRRRSPRVDTRGDAALSFLKPFPCDAPVVNLSTGGLAFEHGAELGRLRTGSLLRDVLLELGDLPVIPVQGKIVGQVVAELGGLNLPRRYRVSLAFQGLSPEGTRAIETFLAPLVPGGLTA